MTIYLPDFSPELILRLAFICIGALMLGIYAKKFYRVAKLMRNGELYDNRQDDDEQDDEPAELLHMAAYWVCDSCGTQFRLSPGETPHICPSCGTRLTDEGVCNDSSAYICPHCGPFFLPGGDDADCCPVCGSEDIEEVELTRIQSERWVCTDCSQEFTAPSIPHICPSCGTSFTECAGEVDSKTFKCRTCGKETEMLNEDEMEYCPHCGEQMKN